MISTAEVIRTPGERTPWAVVFRDERGAEIYRNGVETEEQARRMYEAWRLNAGRTRPSWPGQRPPPG